MMKVGMMLKAMSVVCLIVSGMARAEEGDMTQFKLTLKFTKNFVITEEYKACSGHCVQYMLINGVGNGYESPVEFLAGEVMYVEHYASSGKLNLDSEESMKKMAAGDKAGSVKAPWLRIKMRYADYPDDHKYLKSEILEMLKSLGYFTVTMGWQ